MADESDEKTVEEKEEEEAEEVEEEEEGDEKEEEAPVRKSAAYFVGLRQGKKLAKKEAEEKGDDDGDELTPKAEKALIKHLEPIVDGMKKSADDLEIREYLASHPEKRKFEKAIRRRAESWKDVPIEEIGKTVGNDEEREERKEKRETTVKKIQGASLRGSSNRAEEVKLPSTQEEFAAIYKEVKRGKSVKLGE